MGFSSQSGPHKISIIWNLRAHQFVAIDAGMNLAVLKYDSRGWEEDQMPPLKTAIEMFEEMIRQGVISPAAEISSFEMPSLLRSVPTITTYSTAEPHASLGADDYARLETRSRTNRRGAGQAH
jgi:hypothetical protein